MNVMNLGKKHLLISMLVLSTSVLFAQSNNDKKKYDKAEAYYIDENFSAALPLFNELLTSQPDNANILFMTGVCYLKSATEREKAIELLEKASLNINNKFVGGYKEKGAPAVAFKYLGNAYHFNYNFDKAIENYEKFKALLSQASSEANQDMITQVTRDIEVAQNAKELILSPVNITVENLGPNVNSTYSDHSPVVAADELTLYFTSRREGSTGNEKDIDGQFFEDIYSSTRKNSDSGWANPVNLGPPINTNGHEATIGLSVDGQKLLIYKDDLGDGNVYISDLVGTSWSYPQKVNENVNSGNWEPNASISADASILFFSSNREGGYGGKDIYMSKKLPSGDWAKAVNLGPKVNSPYDEDAPYIHPDGVTLFFSSKGHKSMGGFDIFFTTLSDNGEWTTPNNMGYPVNTTDDDLSYFPTADNKKAYFSSFRPGGFGEKDLYLMTFPDTKEKPLTIYKGTIQNVLGGKIPGDIQITVTDNETGELIGIYSPNVATGKYLFILTPGRNYNISYESDGLIFHSENLDVPKESSYNIINAAVDMQPVKVGTRIVLKNIFFDFDKWILKPESTTELEKVYALMTAKDKLVIEISSHTDSKGDDNYNMKLSQKRAQSVVDYLTKKGIDKKRMIAVGYGETQPIAQNLNPDGTDNEEGRARNRRIEFRILSTEGDLDVIKNIKAPK